MVMTDGAEVTVAINALVNMTVKVRVELRRRRKKCQTYSDQLPA